MSAAAGGPAAGGPESGGPAPGRPRPTTAGQYVTIAYPLLLLLVFFVVPFSIMLAVSFFQRIEGAFYEPAFQFANYARFLTPFFTEILLFSIALAALAALLSVGLGFPFTYLLTRLPRRRQVPVLVFVLAVLSLSEVIIGFSWSTLLSRTAGLSNLLAWLGLLERPQSWSSSFAALLTGLVYLGLPYTVLILYPRTAQLDPELPEAARMLGASPVKAFFTVTLPALRRFLLGAVVMVFVFDLGAYLLPQVLGKPPHWTLSVHITDQAIYQSNLPFAAAMAVFLMLLSLALVGLAFLLEGRGGRR